MGHRIVVKRRRTHNTGDKRFLLKQVDLWAGYWRQNIHRFITEYLGLTYYADFQPILLFYMDRQPYFIYASSRGLAKSTLTLLYCIARCILYPGTKIIVVAPLKSQAQDFIKKTKDFCLNSENLLKEINGGWDGIKVGANGCSVEFANGSQIITKTFSEGSRGTRGTILIVDEFAMIKDKSLLTNVFVPMLTSPRAPLYRELSMEERAKLTEPTRQLYLSSIRTEMEWSWDQFVTYLNAVIDGDRKYGILSLPYQLGVKGGYILRDNVEQVFKQSPEMAEYLRAEYLAIPIRGDNGSFFKYSDLERDRDQYKVMVAKTDDEYLQYRGKEDKWPYYISKLPGEIRVLSMDVALIESKRNDNTSFWITRLIPDGDKYYKAISYAESLHGINSVVQSKRLKQLFYEFECDFVGIDGAGAGMGEITPFYIEICNLL